MKAILLVILISTGFTFSQSTVKIKKPVSIEFYKVKDTIFTGYQNIIAVKGISDFRAVTLEMENATISFQDEVKHTYAIIPTIGGGKNRVLIVKNKNKEIYRTNVYVTVMTKETAERLKKENGSE